MITHYTPPDALWWWTGANYCGSTALENLTIVREQVTCSNCLKMLAALDELEKVEA